MEKVVIHRNIIENTLIKIKDSIKLYKKGFLVGLVVFIVLAVSGVSFAFIYTKHIEKIQAKYGAIMSAYQTDFQSENGKQGLSEKTAESIVKLTDSARWGFIKENGYYIAAGLYFKDKNYSKALEYYEKFSKKSSDSAFAQLALQQVGICYENMNDYKKALDVYVGIEKKGYSNFQYKDKLLYDIGRVYQRTGDKAKAKEYYEKLIKDFPVSRYGVEAKKRLFLLNTDVNEIK